MESLTLEPRFMPVLRRPHSRTSVLTREGASPSLPLSLPPGQSDAGAQIATSAAWLGTQIHFFKPVSPSH